MNERNVNNIRKHLEDENAQQRVQDDILRAREDVTVTIGRAAQLFDFSESQLRDWEGRGFLRPRRSKDDRGQRLYALSELDKLALLKELMGQGGFTLGNIPPHIDEIWHSIYSSPEAQNHGVQNREVQYHSSSREPRSIDVRVEESNKEDFWHYYISQTLRIALSVIFEDIPETIAGIILPLERKENALTDWDSQDLSKLGACLIGWRDQDRAFHAFYEEVPSFAFPSDFRVRGLYASEHEAAPGDRTFVVIQRKARSLSLPLDVVEAVRRFLTPIYEDIDIWLPAFKNGPRDFVYSTTVLRGLNSPDSLLNFLANQVVRLGGKNAEGKDRWKFSCILLPRNPNAFLQMRTLVVQAQSKRSPHVIDKTIVTSDDAILSLSQRALQSIHMLFRSPISLWDTTIVYREQESPLNSAIAMPLGGEDGTPLGVLYVVSEETDVFGKPYQRVLRLMGRIIGELLEIVRVRRQSEERLRAIIEKPRVVNKTLESYDSENKFIGHIEELLRSIRATNDPTIKGNTSFISIDIDDLSSITNKYGDQIAINLSKQLGDRIRNQLGVLFGKAQQYQIYHAFADRFYIMLRDIPLERARETAEKLRLALGGNYSVSILPLLADRTRSAVELTITVRLAVGSYKHAKLYEVLQRYPVDTQIADVRSTIPYFLDTSLNTGKQEGGNNIVTYYPPEPPKYEHSRFALWSPTKAES